MIFESVSFLVGFFLHFDWLCVCVCCFLKCKWTALRASSSSSSSGFFQGLLMSLVVYDGHEPWDWIKVRRASRYMPDCACAHFSLSLNLPGPETRQQNLHSKLKLPQFACRQVQLSGGLTRWWSTSVLFYITEKIVAIFIHRCRSVLMNVWISGQDLFHFTYWKVQRLQSELAPNLEDRRLRTHDTQGKQSTSDVSVSVSAIK